MSCSAMLLQVSNEQHSIRLDNEDLRILVTVADGDAFALVEVTLLGPDEVDGDLDLLANELLAKEFLSFLRVWCLSRVRRPF